MARIPTLMTVGRRYELTNLLGKGGMGSVYRARDLFSGKWVALKRVTIAAEELIFEQSQENANLELAMAMEFKALAALRHPHIISVYDFGFDHRHGPYFTMEYIEDGKPVTYAGHACSIQEKIELIIQMLHALAYLHRRGILHRDLKPANALLKNGKVKLLDFGLSVNTGHTVQHVTETTVGTLAYIAPEIFSGAPYSRSSDLYGLGIIAIELLTGGFPYEDTNLAILLNNILNKDVDFADSELPAELKVILERMVAKPLENRYGNCLEIISDLSQAVGTSAPPQSDDLRVSFFQAAKFVGRSAELAHLVNASAEAARGRGSAVLIEGESGAGKSRLADEMRIRALVEGAVVLEGQAIDRGQSPFQTWQEPLKMLALLADADNSEAAILSSFVPNLAEVLGRTIPESPPANPAEARQLLSRTIIKMIDRLDYPVTVILEDIHWAGSESIQLLDSLASASHKLRCLIIGTYRTDEDHLILDEASAAERISLGRLTEEEVARLGASMLGAAANDQEIIQFLLKESEGNAFFLVEVARAVSEEAGGLNPVKIESLPQSVISGGMASILNRRINRVPEEA